MHLMRADELAVTPLQAARSLLGCVIESSISDTRVGVRLVEVEAYWGAKDPASHSYRGRTARNAVMFGPAGRLYVYFVYGMHFCVNVVCLTDGDPGAVLLRAGEVRYGLDAAKSRRAAARTDSELAKGPARLTSALGLTREHNGVDLTDPDSPVRLLRDEAVGDDQVCTGPRVGVAAAKDTPWRYWIAGSPAVSVYRRGGKRSS
ncbi:MAG: DNA-3-methyladenine glycosylase [Pseudonocardiaceae bacterium]|nr:DNA-3-methyladenine glycosylase [Pseudonocardiaceae bacterium]